MSYANPWDSVWRDLSVSGPIHGVGEFLSRWGELKRLVFSELRRSGKLNRESVVLEAGCGTGTVMGMVGRKCSRVVGVDLSLEGLAHARKRSPEVAAARVQCLPFPDGAFDLVYSTGVFDLLSDEDLHAAVGESLRVTAPGGSVVIICAAPNRLHRMVMGHLTGRGRWRYGPKREVASLRAPVLHHRPDASVEERGRGMVQQLRSAAYLAEHVKVLRWIAHSAFLAASILLWPLNLLPGAVLVTHVRLPGVGR